VDSSWDASVQAVAVLEEPTRRRLYEYVAGQEAPVSRDDAAAALGIPRTTVAFHLDKLTDEGLLDTCYERRSGRTGPGAGRPAKLYHRSDREIEITLPERQYAVAGQLLAAAIQDSETADITPREAVNRRAAEYGEALGRTARARHEDAGHRDELPAEVRDELLVEVLEAHGFEPRLDGGDIALANCPFRRLAKEHPQLVCGMNLHLVAGLLTSLDTPLRAELAPTPGHCCVRITGPAPLTKPTNDGGPARD
jgi:predicted ArsR family transcriptional regulator